MFSWKEFEKTKVTLSHMGGPRYRDEWGQHHIKLRPTELLEWMELVKEDLGFFTLVEVTSITRSDIEVEIIYALLNMGSHQRLNFHLTVRTGEVVPSIVRFFQNAEWLERELAERFPVLFDEKKLPLLVSDFPLEAPELRYNPNKSEAPYPEESYVWKSFGLLSPLSKGNFEWMLCFDPSKAVASKVRIGFHHVGFESMLEKKDLIQTLQLVDRLNFSSAPTFAIAWAKTIEEQFRIKIPERAQAIRIVLLELARICDHLTVLTNVCRDAGQEESSIYLDAREKVYELFEKLSGHRRAQGLIKIGGVKEDLPPGWIVEYQTVSDLLHKNLRIVNNSLVGQTKFREHLNGDALNAQLILQYGVSGPAMRAAGLNFDLRKSQPFYFYQDIDFDIPVGIQGTTYDRYLIRFEEIFQSLRIITQVIDNLPLGDVMTQAFDKNYLELMQTFSALEWPREWHYSAVESPSGECGFLVKFEEKMAPARLKIKTPGFTLAQGLPLFVNGLREEQIPACLSSLGLSRWEMDR